MRPVRYTQTHDDRALAWMRTGSGPPLVKAANWMTHLEYDAESPIWSHWIRFLEGSFEFLRHDERGCGLSDSDPGALDLDSWVDDLRRVTEAADMPTPFCLLGMSQGAGTAVAFAARYPERVSRLILYGGYTRGSNQRGNPQAAALNSAVIEVLRQGWDSPSPQFRELFTRPFVPDGSPEKTEWFNELCRRTTTSETAATLMRSRMEMNADASLPRVSVPTLVIHADGDAVSPIEEGRRMARAIPGAEFVVLPGVNHILQSDEPAWTEFCAHVRAFAGLAAPPAEAGLTAREVEILELICAAKSNKAIARDLEMSEKTVRNHATSIFAKLGVSTRQEAMLKMRTRAP